MLPYMRQKSPYRGGSILDIRFTDNADLFGFKPRTLRSVRYHGGPVLNACEQIPGADIKEIARYACEGVYSAKMARAINNANILCMGGWIVGPEMAVEMTKTFLATEWCQDLEDWRKENMKKFSVQVKAIEDEIYG